VNSLKERRFEVGGPSPGCSSCAPSTLRCPLICYTDVDVLRLLGIFGEVESIGISTRGMDKLSSSDGGVFLPIQWTGIRGETSTRPCFTKCGQELVLLYKGIA
jgi:hypothetical protein